jgi:exosortase
LATIDKNRGQSPLSRGGGFAFYSLLIIAIFYTPITDLVALSLSSELYSHVLLIPFISGYFLYTDRKAIFSNNCYSAAGGIAIAISAITIYLSIKTLDHRLEPNNYLSLAIFSWLFLWLAGFLLFFGAKAFRAALFPLLFLAIIIPIPTFIVDKIIYSLQKNSAEASYYIFKLTGVPIFREGLVFHLPGVSVEVAKECSGIRSSIALLITSILAGHMFLKTSWRRLVLVLLVFPLAILKNSMRIVTLSLLGAYVDISFLTNSLLHKKGGILFFIMALIIFAPIFWLLKRSEGGSSKGRGEGIHHG